jgi:DNA-binding response OmpR family regulator
MESPPTILIIEDDPIIGRALCRALHMAGHKYDYVGNCSSTVDLRGPYAAAIIDIHFPDGNGLDLFEQLLARGVVSSAIFFSAATAATEVTRAIELGTLIHKSHGVAKAVDVAIRLAADFEMPESTTRASTPRMPAARLTPTETIKAQ